MKEGVVRVRIGVGVVVGVVSGRLKCRNCRLSLGILAPRRIRIPGRLGVRVRLAGVSRKVMVRIGVIRRLPLLAMTIYGLSRRREVS